MTALAEVIAAMQRDDEGGWRASVPDGWLQGRTAYGGFSTALALHVARDAEPDLPPLRSAQVAFIGPLSGTVRLSATRLRRGRNAAWMQVDIIGEAGLGLRATFVFMAAIDSRIDHRVASAPDFERPVDGERTFSAVPGVSFTHHFDFLDCRDARAGPAEWLRWVRLRERDGLHPEVALACVADCLPPAALKLVGAPAPVSSMTWQLDLLGPVPDNPDGWWLLRAATDHAHAGGSSQAMAIWDGDRNPVAEQRQSVALFV